MPADKRMFGFYSQKAEKRSGSVFYGTPAGHRVCVTVVESVDTAKSVDGKPVPSSYRFDDVVFVGEVTGYLGVAAHDPLAFIRSAPRVLQWGG